MNGEESPFLPGWQGLSQREMYPAVAPTVPPPSPSLSSGSYPGNSQAAHPGFYQLFGTGYSRGQPNPSLPVRLPYHQQILQQQQQTQQQQQQNHYRQSGAKISYSEPTSVADFNQGPVNPYDGRKNLISDSNKAKYDIYNFQDTSKTALSYSDASYKSGRPIPPSDNGDDILATAHNAMLEKSGLGKGSRQLSSPFTPVQNHHFQPIKSPVPQAVANGYPASHSRSTTPQLLQNTNQTEVLKTPVDCRPENQMSPLYTDMHAKSANFWSQFGLPPPNIKDLNLPRPSSRNSSGINLGSQYDSQTEKLMPKPKTTKVKRQKSLPSIDTQSPHPSLSIQTVEKKKDAKFSRKKKEEDPSIKDLVDAKVQEIMAAVRGKEMGKSGETAVPGKMTESISSSSDNRYPVGGSTYGNEKSDLQVKVNQFDKAANSFKMADSSSHGHEIQKVDNQLGDNKPEAHQPYNSHQSYQPSQRYNSEWNASNFKSQGTVHYKPPSTIPQDLRYKKASPSEQIAEVRNVRKERHSPVNVNASAYKSNFMNNPPDPKYNMSSLSEQITDVRNARKERNSPTSIVNDYNRTSALTEQINEVRNSRKERSSPLNLHVDNKQLSSLTEQVTDVRNERKERHSPLNIDFSNLSSLSEQITDVRNTRKERKSPLNLEMAQNAAAFLKENDFGRCQSGLSKLPVNEVIGINDPSKNIKNDKLTPCCSDCGKAGVLFSANCQSLKKKQSTTDSYTFDAFEEQHQQLLRQYSVSKPENQQGNISRDIYNEAPLKASGAKISGSSDTVNTIATDKDSIARQFMYQMSNKITDNKSDSENRQQNPNDLSFKTKPFSYSSDSSSVNTKPCNLSNIMSVQSSITSSTNSTSSTPLPKFSSTWGSSSHSYSQWLQRECPSVQERSRLPSATGDKKLNSVNSGPVKVKGKPGRKPKKDKLLQNQVNGSKRPLADVLNLVPNSLAANESIVKTWGESLSESSIVDKGVERFIESDVLNSLLENSSLKSKDINSVTSNKDLELSESVAEGSKLPEDSGIGLEIDDEKLTSLPDGVSPEKVGKIKEQIESLKALVTGDAEVNARLANNMMIEVPKCDCLGPNSKLTVVEMFKACKLFQIKVI